ncbi:MAG: hypothetical protein ACRERD_04935 [Candidatus Binatia bacterium]
MADHQLEPGSFRDRTSRVFYHAGTPFRGLTPAALQEWEAPARTRFFRRFTAEGKVVHTELVDAATRPGLTAGSDWAADAKHAELPEAILIFVNGKSFYSGWTYLYRPDVALILNKPALQYTGFQYMFPTALLKNVDDLEIRVFALSKRGVASELNYRPEYKWRKKTP